MARPNCQGDLGDIGGIFGIGEFRLKAGHPNFLSTRGLSVGPLSARVAYGILLTQSPHLRRLKPSVS
jgi:hypothetical protein